MKSFILLSTASALLCSCMVGPDFSTPQASVPATWASSPPPKSSSQDLASWWNLFQDNQLKSFIAKGLTESPDILTAVSKIKQARSQLTVTGSTLWPSISGSAGYNIAPQNGFRQATNQSFNLGSNLSWELDVFGGTGRAVEAQKAALMASVASAGSIRTTLAAEIAVTYFSWITAQEQLRTAKEQLDIQKTTHRIAVARHESGFVPRLDVEQATAQVSSTENQIPALEAQIASTHNALSILLGTYKGQLNINLPSEHTLNITPSVPVGLPSDLLRRRPDILAAEANLHQATANLGVSIANLYPKFSLSGSVNTGASDFGSLFKQSTSGWSIGPNVLQPIFQAGALRANVKIQEEVVIQQGEQYRQAILNAVGEVEDALISYGQYTKQLDITRRTNQANKEAAKLALKLYREGQTDFLNVSSAQQSWLSSEESIVVLKQNIRKSIVQLSKALGGGW